MALLNGITMSYHIIWRLTKNQLYYGSVSVIVILPLLNIVWLLYKKENEKLRKFFRFDGKNGYLFPRDSEEMKEKNETM